MYFLCQKRITALQQAGIWDWESRGGGLKGKRSVILLGLQIPTVGFLYIAGYIGSVGREYLNIVKKEKKPTDKEIIIDVPLALKLSLQGAGWPLRVVQQLRNGTLLEDDKNITVSPR